MTVLTLQSYLRLRKERVGEVGMAAISIPPIKLGEADTS